MENSNVKVWVVKVLLVDDNHEDVNLVKNFLVPKGYTVLEARSGEEALQKVKQFQPNIVVLDWLLPGISGVEVCKELKNHMPSVPVLMLSVHRSTEHKVQAFQAGCDDYLSKPCELEELEIRLQNLLKRVSTRPQEKVLRLGDISMDVSAHRVSKAGKIVDLTIKEYTLLEYLMINSGKVVTRNMILEQVWGENTETFTNIVDVYVNYLRKKLDTPLTESYIKTIRGVGYLMEDVTAKKAAA